MVGKTYTCPLVESQRVDGARHRGLFVRPFIGRSTADVIGIHAVSKTNTSRILEHGGHMGKAIRAATEMLGIQHVDGADSALRRGQRKPRPSLTPIAPSTDPPPCPVAGPVPRMLLLGS